MVKYRVDSIFRGQARLLIVNPSDGDTQELIVKGGESVIVTGKGKIKYSVDTTIIPIDCDGQDLDRK